MSHVLIWRHMLQGSELDIFHSTDYSALYNRVTNKWYGQVQNWGNRLWFQGVYSAIETADNTFDFLPSVINYDEINATYDFVILSCANIFNIEYSKGLREYAQHFEKIKIPVFVIACGVQADSYDSLNDVIAAIGEDSKRFIRAIYNTGGEFALRGYFTKGFFDRLGFRSAVVTGCPSLFQLGPNFQVSNAKIEVSNLHPVFNGRISLVSELMTEYADSVFMDQDQFFYPLFQPNYLNNMSVINQMRFNEMFGKEAARYLAEGRIVQIADMNDWWNYLQDKDFNFSFGSRIHGTIMSLLSGVPATIVTQDSRTREMAEFFDIPRVSISRNESVSKQRLHDIYTQADYSTFNASFKKKFENYENFLVSHGIVSKVNTHNRFFIRDTDSCNYYVNQDREKEFAELYAKMKRNQLLLTGLHTLHKIKGKLF